MNVINYFIDDFNDNTLSWEQRRLGEIAEILMGHSPSGKTYYNTPNKYILVQGNADLVNGRVTPRVWTTHATTFVKKDYLLITVRAPVGDMGKTAYDIVIGRGIAAIKGNEFIYQYLINLKNKKYWKQVASGSIFDSLTQNALQSVECKLPSIPEQSLIGEFFRRFDNLLTLHRRKCVILRKMTQILQEKEY